MNINDDIIQKAINKKDIFEQLSCVTKELTDSTCQKHVDFFKDKIRINLIELNKKMNAAIMSNQFEKLQKELIPQLLEITNK